MTQLPTAASYSSSLFTSSPGPAKRRASCCCNCSCSSTHDELATDDAAAAAAAADGSRTGGGGERRRTTRRRCHRKNPQKEEEENNQQCGELKVRKKTRGKTEKEEEKCHRFELECHRIGLERTRIDQQQEKPPFQPNHCPIDQRSSSSPLDDWSNKSSSSTLDDWSNNKSLDGQRQRQKATSPASSSASATSNKSGRLPHLLLLPLFFVALLLLLPLPRAEAIRCYCTDEHCVPYGVCEASVCLVGLLRATNAVIRTCGSQPLGCQRNVDRWSHICSCDDNFCNTFLFLKASTSIDGPRTRSEGSRSESSGSGVAAPGDHRVFERVEQGPGEFATFDHASGGFDEEPAPIKNSNMLTLLLVIVPLSVGAAAVVVVAINYYCHLC